MSAMIRLSVGLFALLAQVTTLFASVPLAEDGRPLAIVIDHEHEAAARVLVAGIEQATGVRLPVVPDETFRWGRHDLVGRHDLGLIPDDGPGGRPAVILRLVEPMDADAEDANAYRLHMEDGALHITAVSEDRLIEAVRHFLSGDGFQLSRDGRTVSVSRGRRNGDAPPGFHPALNPVRFEAVPEGADVVLVADGQARATVVVPEGAKGAPRGAVMQAAREWVEHVELATGVKLDVVEEQDAPAEGNWVLIGDGALSRTLGMTVDALPIEGFHVCTFDADGRSGLMIAGCMPGADQPEEPGTPAERISAPRRPQICCGLDCNGTLFGVYDALERFVGVRWYYPDDDGRVVPRLDTLAIPTVAYSDAPVFQKRTAWLATRGLDWRAMMRRHRTGNATGIPTFAHSPGSWRVHADHPETFELMPDGRRHNNMPCYGNPKTAQLYVEDIARFYETGDTAVWTHPYPHVDTPWHPPTRHVIPISPPDKGVECRCDYCRPLYDEDADRHGRASRVVAHHVRLVAEAVAERWPDKLVWYLPYANYTVPPADLELPGNVVVGVCLMRGAANAKDPDVAATHERWIAEWHRIAGHKVHLWEYLCWPADETALPFQYPHVLKDFYLRHRDTVAGSFINGGYAPAGLAGGNFASFHPTIYCWMRLLWNPEFDVDAAIEEHVRLMYGSAREPMGRLISLLTSRWQDTQWEMPPAGRRISPRQIHEETMPRDEAAKLAAWLAEARALAGDEGVYRRRVDFLGNAVDIFLVESRDYHEQTGVPTLPVLKVGALPVLDSRLDDPCWRDAPSQPFVNARSARNPEPEAPSTVQAVWTDEGIVFGFRFTEPKPDQIRALRTEHDQDVWADDCIEIFIDARGQREDFVQIVLNSLGAVFDQHSRDGVDWDAEGLQRGVHIGDDFWSLEVFVPFAAFPGVSDAPRIGDIWFGNFIRSRHGTGEWQLTRWSTRYRYSNHDFSAFGRLRFVE